jgi:hypothetical protein
MRYLTDRRDIVFRISKTMRVDFAEPRLRVRLLSFHCVSASGVVEVTLTIPVDRTRMGVEG